MKLNLLLMVILNLFILSSQAETSRPVESVIRLVQPFRILTIQDHLKVIIKEGSTASVTITGDAKKINNIRLEQLDDRLVLSTKGFSSNTGNVVVYVTVSDLRILEITNNAEVTSASQLGGELLWVKLAGNGAIDLETTARKVLTTSFSDGKIQIRGNYQSCTTYWTESGRLVTAYSKIQSKSNSKN